MNGAQALVRTLVGAGVDVCFMNPGTSEMHTVAALDAVPEMRGVLALFEGVVTGAADGYGRMAGKPAATLLHLGPGLGNGLANLHNARRARTPIVNIVGDHATYHKKYDAQLESDIETVARNVSGFIRRVESVEHVASDVADTVAAASTPPGQVASLLLPADAAWTDGAEPAMPVAPPTRGEVGTDRIAAVAAVLRGGEPSALFVGGSATRREPLAAAGRISAHTGAKLMCETFPARLERGAGIVPVERLAYLAELASMQLAGLRHLVLVDAKAPVAFFAYPGKESYLVPDGCEVHVLAGGTEDAASALAALEAELGATSAATPSQGSARPELPSGGALTAESLSVALGALMPEGAIVSDEGITSSIFSGGPTAGAPPHDWLTLTGGAIGQGLPAAVGAAVACPDRRVIAFQADGSALYTLQSWWTMAREGLDVTTILCNNGSYSVLNMELQRVGAEPPGPKAKAMLDLKRPDLDFVALAEGLGVTATRATTNDEFADQLGRALATPGPTVIEAMIPPAF
ncbi:MAG TPA: acetolactate synthase large subunit [Acidimicrobiales bacterium]|nr:acetolactate synthase large subunit [Acidimicrobiales bacterium]